MHLLEAARGDTRLFKKRSMADLVKSRLAKWKSDPDTLWKDVVERSKKSLAPPDASPRPKPDSTRLESSVIAALPLGDVRKALQMLNSAATAPKRRLL